MDKTVTLYLEKPIIYPFQFKREKPYNLVCEPQQVLRSVVTQGGKTHLAIQNLLQSTITSNNSFKIKQMLKENTYIPPVHYKQAP